MCNIVYFNNVKRNLGHLSCTRGPLSQRTIDRHCCSSVLMLRSHVPPSETVFPHLYTPLTVLLVLVLSSRLSCSQDICRHLSTPLIPRVINSLLTYLLRTRVQHPTRPAVLHSIVTLICDVRNWICETVERSCYIKGLWDAARLWLGLFVTFETTCDQRHQNHRRL